MKRLSFVIAALVSLALAFWAGTVWVHTSAEIDRAINIEKSGLFHITETLDRQSDAWNAGDIDGFMADYVRDETLRFASGGDVEYGWQPTLERYKRLYATPEAMGELTFSEIDVTFIGVDDALVFGRWKLQRETDAPGGLFTLHMIRRDGGWVIQSDHTSSSAIPQ